MAPAGKRPHERPKAPGRQRLREKKCAGSLLCPTNNGWADLAHLEMRNMIHIINITPTNLPKKMNANSGANEWSPSKPWNSGQAFGGLICAPNATSSQSGQG